MFGPHLPFGLLASTHPDRPLRHPACFGSDAAGRDAGSPDRVEANHDLPVLQLERRERRARARLRLAERVRRKAA